MGEVGTNALVERAKRERSVVVVVDMKIMMREWAKLGERST